MYICLSKHNAENAGWKVKSHTFHAELAESSPSLVTTSCPLTSSLFLLPSIQKSKFKQCNQRKTRSHENIQWNRNHAPQEYQTRQGGMPMKRNKYGQHYQLSTLQNRTIIIRVSPNFPYFLNYTTMSINGSPCLL